MPVVVVVGPEVVVVDDVVLLVVVVVVLVGVVGQVGEVVGGVELRAGGHVLDEARLTTAPVPAH
ncbi:hypothetical protein K7G98_30670 [Saccharothrix sp. MB29]|nr:hypothetical protein [Saccharothrix sp. MB29]